MIAAQEILFSAPMAARGTGVKINRAGRRGAASSTFPKIQQWALDDAITVVLFAGLGGACQGLEEAGMPVNVANNHDEVAIAAHQALHPHTKHIRGDISGPARIVGTIRWPRAARRVPPACARSPGRSAGGPEKPDRR
jgi:DNA (cytosine-5)-methyltransferase 1